MIEPPVSFMDPGAVAADEVAASIDVSFAKGVVDVPETIGRLRIGSLTTISIASVSTASTNRVPAVGITSIDAVSPHTISKSPVVVPHAGLVTHHDVLASTKVTTANLYLAAVIIPPVIGLRASVPLVELPHAPAVVHHDSAANRCTSAVGRHPASMVDAVDAGPARAEGAVDAGSPQAEGLANPRPAQPEALAIP